MRIERTSGRPVVCLPTSFGHAVAGVFLRSVKSELEKGSSSLSIDFKETRLIDSAGIGTLVSVAKDCRANGASLTLCNINEDIRDLFVQTGFDKIFTIEWKEGIKTAESDIFENAVDIRLYIEKESVDDICILHLNGVMNNPDGSRYFKQEFLLAMARYKKVVLDFIELTFFDSLSVSVILNMNRLLKETGGSMRIYGPNEIIGDFFKSLNIHKVIPIYTSKEDALKGY
jgi:anti-sigma B factor antagonist